MLRLIQILLLQVIIYSLGLSQSYIGGGNVQQIIVTASDQYHDKTWPKAATAANTINGEGLDSKELEASRFLIQATLGYEERHIDYVAESSIERWIDFQIPGDHSPKSLAILKLSSE